jgi:hypothetical protein
MSIDVGEHLQATTETSGHLARCELLVDSSERHDGKLNLSVDVDVADAEVDVIVTVTPVQTGPVDENGWPAEFFDRVAGSMPELRRGSQGEFEERHPLE